MNYDVILVRYGEIALKGKNRHVFEDRLLQNIRNVLKDLKGLKMKKTFGRIFIELNGEDDTIVINRLKKIFGLVSFSPVKRTELEMEAIMEMALQLVNSKEKSPRTFKVETKRAYKLFPIKSPDITYQVGSYILKNTEDLKVDVHSPELTVYVEVREEGAFIYSETMKGIGGMPAMSGGKGLLLLSGGIDSPVAGWYAMKRGLTVEGIHFHTHPVTSVDSIQKVIDLAKAISKYSGQFKVHFVPFLEIQKEIKEYALESHYITIMRRMFLRISEKIAEQRKGLALITGESIGQVASQTLESMNTINHVTNMPIIRPLITMDKQEIIEKAIEIDTYDASIRPFEDCCSLFVPRNPATRPSIKISERAERSMDIENLIQDAISRTRLVTFTPHSEIKAEEILFTDIVGLK